MRKRNKNDSIDFEKKFLEGHVDKVNRLSSRLYFILSFLCIILYIFCRIGFYNYPVDRALFIVVFAISSSTILLIYDRKIKNHKAKSIFKYLLLIATQVIVVCMATDVNLTLTVSYLTMPLFTVMYFDPVFTFISCIVSAISQLIGVVLKAEQGVEMFWPGITPMYYIITNGSGVVLEYIFITALLTFSSKTARNYMYSVFLRNQKLAQVQRQILYSLADIIESSDTTTGQHGKRTTEVVTLINKYLLEHNIYTDECSINDMNLISMAAPLHDIGKMKVPEHILLKPGRLSPEEFEEIKKHPVEGSKIILQTLLKVEDPRFVQIAHEMTLYHHEKWNGTGYPDGLKEKQIPISARIMAIADVFDALCSARPYKEKFSFEQAMDILKDLSGKHFDPELVNAMFSMKDELRKLYFETA